MLFMHQLVSKQTLSYTINTHTLAFKELTDFRPLCEVIQLISIRYYALESTSVQICNKHCWITGIQQRLRWYSGR